MPAKSVRLSESRRDFDPLLLRGFRLAGSFEDSRCDLLADSLLIDRSNELWTVRTGSAYFSITFFAKISFVPPPSTIFTDTSPILIEALVSN